VTEVANIECQKSRQAEFVKFGEKKRYSDQECQAIYPPDAGL
jgi:hypothetical protein